MHNDSLNAIKDAANQATDFIRRQADQRSRELGGRLNAAADNLYSTGDDMIDRGQDIAASIARYLAYSVRRTGRYLERTDTRRMMDDARRFAREQPWTVAAIGMLAGFALARAIKHSADDEDGEDG